MSNPTKECGCERGYSCTRATMCAVSAAWDAGVESTEDPAQEFIDEVLMYAKDYEEQVSHGTVNTSVMALKYLLGAIREWQNEIADGAPDAHEH